MKMAWYQNPADNPSDTWYSLDAFDTKEEAIEDGIQQYKEHLAGISTELFDNDYSYPESPSGWFEVGERKDFVPYVDSDLIIEQVAEQASWQCGEIGDDWLNWDTVTEEARKELEENINKVFDDWLKKHSLEPTFFNIVNIEKINVKDYL